MSPGQKKSLTETPKDLKGAIDWVIQIDDLNKINDLAEALEKLVKRDGSDAAVRVKGVYEMICEKFCNISDTLDERPSPVLKYYLKNLETFDRVQPSGNETNEDILKRLKGESGNFKYSITTLAGSLQTFLGCDTSELMSFNGKGIISSSPSNYNPAYKNADWKSEEASECAVILLAICPMLYLGLGLLYGMCGPSCIWSKKNISTSYIKTFLADMGFSKGNLNKNKKGSDIVPYLSGFTELSTGNAKSNDYPNFLGKLQEKALESQTPPNPSHPLTSLYLLSYLYLTSPAYSETSITTSKASIATLGATALAGGAYGLNIGGLDTLHPPWLTSIFDCPSNLKEAIDWILRVTGKDGGSNKNDGANDLTRQVQDLLNGVKGVDTGLSAEQFENVKKALTPGGSDCLIGKLAEGLKKFKDGIHKSSDENVYSALTNGNLTDALNAAKIFLGCVPLWFYGLSYLYWRCDSQGGGWDDQRISGSGIQTDLKDYMTSVGFASKVLNGGKLGSQIFTTTRDNFVDLEAANKKSYSHFVSELHTKGKENLSSSAAPHSLSVLHYIGSLYFNGRQRQKTKEAKASPTTIREMLYFLAALPFSSVYDEFDKYITDQFKTLLKKPEESNDDNLKLDVADSSKPPGGNDTLSAAELKQYLLTSCSFSAVVLGRFQGSGTAEKDSDDPWLHKLFCNSEFTFNFPAAPILFYNLSEYTYALQFQLMFLHGQCGRSPVHGCGWRACKYGQGINNGTNIKLVQSHICPVRCTKSGGNHNTSNHTTGCEHKGCGKAGKPSPLQAFLTDKLKGFSRGHPSDPSSHLATCSGVLCHVPMGFAGKLRTDAGAGLNITYALGSFCGGFNTPLRQLSEKLGCLTKRTPRTLGDLFGFIWHLNSQLFNSREVIEKLDQAIQSKPKTLESLFSKFDETLKTLRPGLPSASSSSSRFGLSDSLKSIAKILPFWEYLFNHKLSDGLPGKLFDLTQHCHKYTNSSNTLKIVHESQSDSSGASGHQCSANPADLKSLYYPVFSGVEHDACRDKDCGGYLHSLTHSYGSTYAPSYASAYLSWMAYLTDVFYE
ncbi:variant erythrocyte surface antigen-1 family protein [Babesia caballi]|uniref:Variant erythrocyte surface antigen-1 family protein n=1 Tax=Babesia caballi TaxID=5871 RepID=A0AAV4LR55_BABCB|nr:variant erythrocyte surface antigen-1 family protein [Babesia caballi]